MAQGAAMIGQLLDRRYRIEKILGSNGLGKTYLAVDTHRPGEPKCVVKQMRLPRTQGKTLEILELIFKKKVEFLEKIGKHDQIPQLLAFFQENKEFYLVEEFIIGHPLSDEIGHGIPMPEDQLLLLLHEIIEILIFVHGHGMVHRQVRAENLMRRAQDGKLVLIDFSPIKEIEAQLLKAQRQSTENKVQNLESQLALDFAQSQAYNTDIYGVGLIGIEAIAGLSAKDLMEISDAQNPQNPILEWHHQVKVRPQLVSMLDKMVHPDPSERYQSAPEVLAALKKLKVRPSNPYPGLTPVPPPPPPIKPARVPPTQVELTSELKTEKTIPWPMLGMAISVGLVLLLSGSAWMLYNQNYTNQRAEELKSSAQERAESGDELAAIQQFTEAIALKPTGESYYQRGNAQFDLGNYQAAVEDYTAALEKDPNYVAAYFNRGLAYLELNQLQLAVDDYSKAIELNSNDADAYYQRGLASHRLKDYSGAIADYTSVIQLNSQDATAFINRGLSYSAADDKQSAIADFTQAIRIDPNNAQAYYSRGRARFFLADYQGAMEDYTEALRIAPEDADTYVNRCGAYLNLANYDKAIADCNQAIELNPKDPAAYSNRCLAYTNLQQYLEALVDCTQAIRLEPDAAKAYSNRGMARAAAEDFQGAIDDYTEAIRLVPNDAVAYSNRGTVYYDLGKYPEALLDYTQAIQFKADYDIAYYKRGLIRVQLKDKAGAIADFQKAGKLCLDRGRTGCYHDAQYQIDLLQDKP
jgi:tetratricopeptide (TPR) repeat protein